MAAETKATVHFSPDVKKHDGTSKLNEKFERIIFNGLKDCTIEKIQSEIDDSMECEYVQEMINDLVRRIVDNIYGKTHVLPRGGGMCIYVKTEHIPGLMKINGLIELINKQYFEEAFSAGSDAYILETYEQPSYYFNSKDVF